MLFATGLGLLLLVKGQILPENIVTEIREHQGMCFMLSIMHGVYTRVGGDGSIGSELHFSKQIIPFSGCWTPVFACTVFEGILAMFSVLAIPFKT